MSRELFEEIPALVPLSFFAVGADLLYAEQLPESGAKRKKFELPDTTSFRDQEKFALFYMSWHESGINLSVEVERPLVESVYPKFAAGDALELFFDTRDLKNAGFMTRFCHHFLILPEAVQGVQAVELTRFRTDDSHPHCDGADIKVLVNERPSRYTMDIFIPASCLHGYAPLEIGKLGFAYKVHRYKGKVQDFAPATAHYLVEQQPALWSSLNCIKEKR